MSAEWKHEPCPKFGRCAWDVRLQDCDDETLTSPTIAVASVMFRYAGADGTGIRPSIATIMKRSRVKERSVRYALSWLRENGWLILVVPGSSGRGRTARAAEYRLSYPATVTT